MVENLIKSGDFIRLTGSTLKTINYYHKIGLLQQPQRSAGGYRLYGAVELNRMRLIKRLKSLGLNLQQIKATLGDSQDPKTSREVLENLRQELFNEKNTLEKRLARIDTLLAEEATLLDEDVYDSPSFQMITEILGTEQIEAYARACPEIYEQQRKLYGLLDDFQWGEDQQGPSRILAQYFKEHPDQYQAALEFGKRWAELSQIPEDDPRIDTLAREAAVLVASMPAVVGVYDQSEMTNPFESLYKEMVAGVLSPAQLKYQQLFRKYLLSQQ